MKKKAKPKKKRLVRGKDWHAWAWKVDTNSTTHNNTLLQFTSTTPYVRSTPTTNGKWVRVKFVEVPND